MLEIFALQVLVKPSFFFLYKASTKQTPSNISLILTLLFSFLGKKHLKVMQIFTCRFSEKLFYK